MKSFTIYDTSFNFNPQPFDFLMRGFHELYFEKDPIPASLSEQLDNFEMISEDGETCRRYLVLLAQTCQVMVMAMFAMVMPMINMFIVMLACVVTINGHVGNGCGHVGNVMAMLTL